MIELMLFPPGAPQRGSVLGQAAIKSGLSFHGDFGKTAIPRDKRQQIRSRRKICGF
jgi:hypothetical protein